MSTGNASVSESRYSRKSCRGFTGGGKFSPLSIAAMVMGFILFWPIGMFILFWTLAGRTLSELANLMQSMWGKMSTVWEDRDGFSFESDSENVVFRDYQRTQYDRIREIKDEIKERSRRFAEFKADVKRKQDQEEFDRFMASAPIRNEG